VPSCDVQPGVSTCRAPCTEHSRQKTVTALDVVYTLKRQERTLYGFGG
jgi:histone H3/H4